MRMVGVKLKASSQDELEGLGESGYTVKWVMAMLYTFPLSKRPITSSERDGKEFWVWIVH